MNDRNAEMICYCFNYTRADIKQDAMRNRRSLIIEKITAAKRLGACECVVKNPKGT